jgi:hypothetical protein
LELLELSFEFELLAEICPEFKFWVKFAKFILEENEELFKEIGLEGFAILGKLLILESVTEKTEEFIFAVEKLSEDAFVVWVPVVLEELLWFWEVGFVFVWGGRSRDDPT